MRGQSLESNFWERVLERSQDSRDSQDSDQGRAACSETRSDLEISTSSALPVLGPWPASPPSAGVYGCLKHPKKGIMRSLLTWGLHKTKLALVASPSAACSGDVYYTSRFVWGAAVVFNSLKF